MAATAPVVARWPEFSLDRHTYDGGWDIYAAGFPAALRLGRFSPRNRPRSVPLAPRQGDLRHVDIATVEDTLGSMTSSLVSRTQPEETKVPMVEG
jgi:hypothetical protein